MTIRKATSDEVPALREMAQALADQDGSGLQVAAEATVQMHGFGASPLIHARLAVACDADGMVICCPGFSTHRGAPGADVQDIFVAPAARGIGVAEHLLAGVLTHQTWGARDMTLCVSPNNAIAKRVYGRLGFCSRGDDLLILDGEKLAALS